MPESMQREDARILKEELGVEHLADVSRTVRFETPMARVCSDAGDDLAALAYAMGLGKRLRHLILDAAEDLAPGHALSYVAGVMIQSHTVHGCDQDALADRLASDAGWIDITTPQLRTVLKMLKTHLKRCA